MTSNLLKKYISLFLESKLPPSTNGSSNGRSGFSKNQQTSGYAGGDGRVVYKDQRIQAPDDGYFYQYMKIDGPNYDLDSDKTMAVCKIDPKFANLFPKELQEYTISAAGVNSEDDVQNKINQFYAKIKNKIDSELGLIDQSDNIYQLDKKNSQSW